MYTFGVRNDTYSKQHWYVFGPSIYGVNVFEKKTLAETALREEFAKKWRRDASAASDVET